MSRLFLSSPRFLRATFASMNTFNTVKALSLLGVLRVR